MKYADLTNEFLLGITILSRGGRAAVPRHIREALKLKSTLHSEERMLWIRKGDEIIVRGASPKDPKNYPERDVDAYIKAAPTEARVRLVELRKIIKATALFRRVGLGVIIPFWMFGVIVPTIVTVIGSAAIGVLLLIGVVMAIFDVARWAKRR